MTTIPHPNPRIAAELDCRLRAVLAGDADHSQLLLCGWNPIEDAYSALGRAAQACVTASSLASLDDAGSRDRVLSVVQPTVQSLPARPVTGAIDLWDRLLVEDLPKRRQIPLSEVGLTEGFDVLVAAIVLGRIAAAILHTSCDGVTWKMYTTRRRELFEVAASGSA